MGKEAWSGVKQLSLAGLGTVIASPVTGVLHGASKVFTTPVAAAAVAWKEKSLGGAIKAAGKECFDTTPGKVSSAAVLWWAALWPPFLRLRHRHHHLR